MNKYSLCNDTQFTVLASQQSQSRMCQRVKKQGLWVYRNNQLYRDAIGNNAFDNAKHIFISYRTYEAGAHNSIVSKKKQ